MKFQQTIILSIMGGMLVGFTAFLTINHEMLQSTAKEEVYNKLKSKTSNLTQNIEEWLETKQRIALALSKQVQTLHDQSPDTIRTYLYLANDAANITASMIYFKGKPLIHTDLSWTIPPEEEEKNMPYQAAKENGFKPTISRVFKSPINKVDNMIAVIAPFNYDSLATLVVELKDIEEKVAKIKFEGGYATLLDADRKVLVHPDTHLQGKALSEDLPELQWLENTGFSKQSGLYELNVRDKDYIIVFDTIKATGWKVIMSLEKEVAFMNVNAQTKKLSIISIAFFIVSLFFMLSINFFHTFWRHQVEKEKEEYAFILAHRSRISEIGELISGINHQLNQPLNSLKLLVTSLLSNLKNKTLTDDVLVQNLHMSQEAITLMATTIGTFRNFYRFNENISQFELKHCIENVLHVLSTEFNKHNLGIQTHYAIKEHMVVTSIENFIQQVLLVLLQNAKDAILATQKKSTSKLQIFVTTKGESTIIDITDWGEGINQEMKEKLFHPIKSSKKDLGSGIGLYFARKIAQEKLEGDLVLLQASSPTTFRFTFKTYLHQKKDINHASSNA